MERRGHFCLLNCNLYNLHPLLPCAYYLYGFELHACDTSQGRDLIDRNKSVQDYHPNQVKASLLQSKQSEINGI